MEHGKEQWLSPRKDPVEAKGKGSMKTFWVDRITTKKGSSVSSGNSSRDCIEEVATPTPSVKTEELSKANKIVDASSARLVNWLVDLLLDDIKKIVSRTLLGAGNIWGEQRKGTSVLHRPANFAIFRYMCAAKPLIVTVQLQKSKLTLNS